MRPSTSLALAVALPLSLVACGGGGSEPSGSDSSASPAPADVDLDAAAALYRGKGSCAPCHGKQGQGTNMNLGPALTGLAEHWDVASLSKFLADPAAVVGDDARLAEMASNYNSPMPPAASLSDGEREAVAAYVLSL